MECLVSIIVPVFNEEALVGAAIESALQQSEHRIELIVIDDCSTDGTVSIAERYAAHDRRVVLLRCKRNRGPAAARNLGLSAARGTWVALLDADDTYNPRRIEALLDIAATHRADMVSDNLVVHRGDDLPYLLIPPVTLPMPRLLTATEFVLGNIDPRQDRQVSYGFMQPVIRRDFLAQHGLRYDERNRFGEDYMLYLKCLQAGARWWVTPEPLYHYAIRLGSLTSVQMTGDLRRIAQLEAEMLADPAISAQPRLSQALRRHKAKIDRLHSYRAVTDAVKQRRFGLAMQEFLQTKRSPFYATMEAARQTPTILRKALRGGYTGRRAALALGGSAEHRGATANQFINRDGTLAADTPPGSKRSR